MPALRICSDIRGDVRHGCDNFTHSFLLMCCHGARMGKIFRPKAAPIPQQKEVGKEPEIIDTSETAENTVKARARKRYGFDKTFTAKGNGCSVFGQSSGASYRKTLG